MDQITSTETVSISPAAQIPPFPQAEIVDKHTTLKVIFGILLFIVIFIILSFAFFIVPNKKKTGTQIFSQVKNESGQTSQTGKLASVQEVTQVNDGSNDFKTLQKIKSVFTFNPETKAISTTLFKMGNGEVWDDNLAKEYLTQNQEALKLLSKFSAQKTYSDPMYQNITKETVASTSPDLTFMKNLLTISNIDFENALRLGDVERARTLFFERLKIANLLLGSHAEELSSIRASALRNQALTGLLPRLLAKEKLSASSSLSFESKILSSPVPPDSYYAFLDTEAKIFAVQNNLSIEELAAGQKDKRVVQILQMAADTSLTDFKAISKVYADETKKPCTEINQENVRNAIDKITTKTGPNKEAESFFDDKVKELFEPKLLYLARKCTDEIGAESALALIGIKAYSDEKGVPPETVSDLVPTFLSALPLDPYDGKLFKKRNPRTESAVLF